MKKECNSVEDSIGNLIEMHENGEKYVLPTLPDTFITERELTEILKVDKRTIHRYRAQKKLPYYQFEKTGKVLYNSAEIYDLMKRSYYSPAEKPL